MEVPSKKPEMLALQTDSPSAGSADLYLQIRAACLEMGDPAAEYEPPITFLVVQKRHHTRFFPQTPRDGDRSGNVPPGAT